MCHHGATRRTGRLLSPLAPSVFDCRPIVGRSVMLINLGAFSCWKGRWTLFEQTPHLTPMRSPSSVSGDECDGRTAKARLCVKARYDSSLEAGNRLRSGRLGFSFATRPPEVSPLCIRWHDSKVRSEAASTSLQPTCKAISSRDATQQAHGLPSPAYFTPWP